MGVEQKHPDYSDRQADWVQMRDTYGGERLIKEAGETYLAATSGMVEDGSRGGDPNARGAVQYNAYRTRARFPDLVSEAVQALLGVMHHKPPVIELPAAMEPIREFATNRGESLEMLLRRINEEQLIVGRIGLLADIEDKGPRLGQPYIATYVGERILNWDEGEASPLSLQNVNLVVLDESGNQRKGFDWDAHKQHRVLVLGKLDQADDDGDTTYQVAIVEEGADFDEKDLRPVKAVKGSVSKEIPFVFVNTRDVSATPDAPPLLPLSNLCLGIYRGEADYRQSLFMQGQDTLVTIGNLIDSDDSVETGGKGTVRTGANAQLALELHGDAKYVGVDSTGLEEQRMALENDYARAAQRAGELLDSVSREKESGDALRIRVAARTATLNQIALTGGYGLQLLLQSIARWIGADPTQVSVAPNLDFIDDEMTGRELVDLMTAKTLGAPIALRSVHKKMQDQGLTDETFEEEVRIITEDEGDLELMPADGSTNPGGPEPEPEPEPAGAGS